MKTSYKNQKRSVFSNPSRDQKDSIKRVSVFNRQSMLQKSKFDMKFDSFANKYLCSETVESSKAGYGSTQVI